MRQHAAEWRSVTVTVTDLEKTETFSDWEETRCLIEPIPNMIRESILARLPTATRMISRIEAFKEGDEFRFEGLTFDVQAGVTEDRYRGKRSYYKGFVAERFSE